MAEVSWRLGSSRAYRLSALKSSSSHSLSNVEGDGTVSAACITGARTCSSKVAVGQLARGNSLPTTRTCKPAILKRSLLLDKEAEHRVQRRSRQKSQNVHATLGCSWPSVTSCCLLVLDFDAKPLIEITGIQDELIHEDQPSLYFSPSMPPLSQVSQIVGRMTCWKSRGVLTATVHPETFVSAQQSRAFSTVLLTPADRGSGPRVSPYPAALAAPACRAYSWRSENDSDTPPLYRSRTAYYDILRVTPNATRSQIKTAYYKQSFIYHPDKNPGSKEATLRFSEISEAYSILGSVNLRRKFDRGTLSQSDVQGAGRPSARENVAASKAGPAQQQQRPRHYSNVGGRPIFDFDAFYQAHYGQQLQRERVMKAKKEMSKQKQKEVFRKWKQGKVMDMTVGVMLVAAGVIFISLVRF